MTSIYIFDPSDGAALPELPPAADRRPGSRHR